MAELIAMTDLYREAAEGWASGAELVYLPLAHALVASSPIALAGRRMLDVGAGTGAGSTALLAVGADPVAVDVSIDMLRHDRARRPPALVADVLRLPLADAAVRGALAPFVLNHLDRPVDGPVDGLREVARVVEPGGVVLVSSFSSADRPAVKDLIDGVVVGHGWQPPASYAWIKDHALDLLGSADRMAEVATASGLVDVQVIEGPVAVGVSSAPELVAFRLGMAHVAAYLASLDPDQRYAIVAEAEAVIEAEHDGSDLAPHVVFLAARVAG